jgi:hypothetical protein
VNNTFQQLAYVPPRTSTFDGAHVQISFAIAMDGQVRLVRLQTNNFCLFLHQQMDKRQIFICTMSQWYKEKR